jgi:hypothetical protein
VKRYLIEESIIGAQGSTTYYQDAESWEQALKQHKENGSDIYENEVECSYSDDQPCCVGTAKLDDFGDYAPPARPYKIEQVGKFMKDFVKDGQGSILMQERARYLILKYGL